jgi:hypothetical protein
MNLKDMGSEILINLLIRELRNKPEPLFNEVPEVRKFVQIKPGNDKTTSPREENPGLSSRK